MGEIRSAWELAMERTKDIKSDPAALRAHEARTRGKEILSILVDGHPFRIPILRC